MKKLMLFFSTIFLIGCSSPKYEIKNKEVFAGGANCKLKVLLPQKTDIKNLTEIANDIREEYSQYNRLFIFYYYYAPDLETDKAWAISHFMPQLEVEIFEYR